MMSVVNAELAAIKDAMDKQTGDGRDRDVARDLAEAYIAAHPDDFAKLATKTVEELAASVDVFRAAGWDEEQQLVETWLLHLFPQPQQVGGILTPGSPITHG